jgi:uncharacterized protein
MNSIILFLGGIFSGLYGSVVGSAGLINFPLLLLTGIPIHSVIATNRFGAIFLQLSSAARYNKAKKINPKISLLLGGIAAAGSLIGATIVVNIDEQYLKLAAALFMGTIFIILVLNKKIGLLEKKVNNNHWAIAFTYTFLLGIYGGFLGIGFGTLMTFTFILIGKDLLASVAMSRAAGLVMSIPAVLVFAYHDLINYQYAIALGSGMAIGAWIGAGMGIKKGNKFIKIALMVILLVTMSKLVIESK